MDPAVLNDGEIGDHLPSYLIRIHPGGRAIYLTALSLLVILLASLPLASVQVSVSGRGIIRPLQEKTGIRVPAQGIVEAVYVKEGDRVNKTQALLRIRSLESSQNLLNLMRELEETEAYLKDLEGLTGIPLKIPCSSMYLGEYEKFSRQKEYLDLILARAEKELARYGGLHREGLISEREFDDLRFNAAKARKEMESFISQSLAGWQAACRDQQTRKRELQIRIRTLEEKIRLTTVCAPAGGSLVEFNGIAAGSAVQAGSLIGILSPDSGLIGEFYISSRDIAYLHTGQSVRLYLDAFPPREWGYVPAVIYEISGDFLVRDNLPVYRVKCSLGRSELCLRNGYSAGVKKGMSFQARCLVARRTLFQLLTDRADQWLNPSRMGSGTPALP